MKMAKPAFAQAPVTAEAIARTIAPMHAASWKNAYRNIYPAHYLDHEVEGERLTHWRKRVPELINGEGEIYLAHVAGEPAGFLCIEVGLEKEWGAFVDNLHVLPRWRGANLGAQLLDRGAGWARQHGQTQLYLWVYELNHAARRFYARQGWQEAERSPAVVAGGQERFVWRLIKRL